MAVAAVRSAGSARDWRDGRDGLVVDFMVVGVGRRKKKEVRRRKGEGGSKKEEGTDTLEGRNGRLREVAIKKSVTRRRGRVGREHCERGMDKISFAYRREIHDGLKTK